MPKNKSMQDYALGSMDVDEEGRINFANFLKENI